MSFPVDSDQWRRWQNTELYVEDYGLRLDEVPDSVREAVMEVLRASLSAKGYETSRAVMRLNRFLGDLVGCPAVLGEWSYTFCLFGAPSATEPWGWQLFRAPSHLDLLRARPANGADAGLPGGGAGLRGYRTVRGHPPVRGRGARRARAHALAVAGAAAAGHRRSFDGRRRSASRAAGISRTIFTWGAPTRTTASFPTKGCRAQRFPPRSAASCSI